MEMGIAAEVLTEAIRGAVQSIVDKLKGNDFAATDLAALLKLIQIDKEIRVESPKQVNVQWVETWESNYLNDE